MNGAREGLEAWEWARKHHSNDHTGDPRPHRDGCGCGNCPVLSKDGSYSCNCGNVDAVRGQPSLVETSDGFVHQVCGRRVNVFDRYGSLHQSAVHPRDALPPGADVASWPRTPYCDGQRAAIAGEPRSTDLPGGALSGGGGEWYAGYDDAVVGQFYSGES